MTNRAKIAGFLEGIETVVGNELGVFYFVQTTLIVIGQNSPHGAQRTSAQVRVYNAVFDPLVFGNRRALSFVGIEVRGTYVAVEIASGLEGDTVGLDDFDTNVFTVPHLDSVVLYALLAAVNGVEHLTIGKLRLDAFVGVQKIVKGTLTAGGRI